jgi:hypothetical protein
MAARNFLKKAVAWPAVFLSILSIGSASASLGYQPAGADIAFSLITAMIVLS